MSDRSTSKRGVRVRLTISLAAFALAGCAGAQEAIPMDERFAPCPESPNCVSTFATDDTHAIEPLPLPSGGDPMERLRQVVSSFPRTKIVTVDGDYLHATFTSRIFRFVDDVEFRIDRENGVIQVRSASRVGYGDMGVNRKRVEALRSRLGSG